MADPVGYVPAPMRHARRGGIKSVADFVDTERLMAVSSVDWTSETCAFPLPAPGLCWGVEVLDDKVPAGVDTLTSGTVFALYAGSECLLGGELDHEAISRKTLEDGEDRALEERLVTYLALVDATPTDFASFALAIAAAESAADIAYLGRPTIVMNRGDVDLATSQMALFADREGNIVTANGTPVLASGHVPAGDLYATGNITVFTSGAIIATTVVHHAENREMAIAERAYALGIDCGYVVAYSVTVIP